MVTSPTELNLGCAAHIEEPLLVLVACSQLYSLYQLTLGASPLLEGRPVIRLTVLQIEAGVWRQLSLTPHSCVLDSKNALVPLILR